MKKYLYAVLTLATVASCGGSKDGDKPANLLASNDFEAFDGWVGAEAMPTLTKEKAHSGSYSVMARPGAEYSNGYNNTLNKLSPIKLNKIKIHGWVYLPTTQTPAVLVTSLTDPAQPKPLLWDGLALSKEVKWANKWVEVEKEITLPANSAPTNRLYVYLWSGGAPTPVFLDDLEILRAE
jgi:hypothetical protein